MKTATMSSVPIQVVETFLATFKEKQLIDICLCLIRAYREAYSYCRENYAGEEAFDLYPNVRRAMFERNWRTRMTRYRDVQIEPTLNYGGNCHHTEMRRGAIVLTSSAVESPGTLVRHAIFRESLAQSSQLELFQELLKRPAKGSLYAILLHGPTGIMLREPQFIQVAFPANDLSSYVENTHIDLLARLPAVREELSGERIPEEELRIGLRRQRRSSSEAT